MSHPDKNESNRDTITFSESEIEKISKLYQTDFGFHLCK